MKVLFWTENFWPQIGGVETFSRQLIFPLRERGYEFAVITSGRPTADGQPERVEGIPVWRYPLTAVLEKRDLPGILAVSKRVEDLLCKYSPDLIHLNTTLPSIFFYMRNPRAIQTPTLLTLHNPLTTLTHPDGIVRQLVNTVRQVNGVSRFILQKLMEAIPEISDRTSLIYNALQKPEVAPSPLPFDPPVLLCAGRMTAQKGFDVALEAFSIVCRRFPEAILWMAGDGVLRAELERQSVLLGLKERVKFLGSVSHREIYPLLNRSCLLLVPSRYEPFGLVALEAAQMARPVVASRVDGLAEIVVQGETGLLLEPDNSEGFADAILSLLSDPAKSECYGRQAQRRAEKEFDHLRFVDAYDTLYHRLCGSVS